jgi:hypothetical protein
MQHQFANEPSLPPSVNAVQDARKESIHKQAEIEAFERHNVGAASSLTTQAIVRQGDAAAEKVSQLVEVDRSSHSIQANEDRARSVRVCMCQNA